MPQRNDRKMQKLFGFISLPIKKFRVFIMFEWTATKHLKASKRIQPKKNSWGSSYRNEMVIACSLRQSQIPSLSASPGLICTPKDRTWNCFRSKVKAIFLTSKFTKSHRLMFCTFSLHKTVGLCQHWHFLSTISQPGSMIMESRHFCLLYSCRKRLLLRSVGGKSEDKNIVIS